jgi:hypothetical protein
MSAIYLLVSFLVFFAVFLSFFRNQKNFVFPVIFLQQFRHFINIFNIDQPNILNLQYIIRVTINFAIQVKLLQIANNFFELNAYKVIAVIIGQVLCYYSVIYNMLIKNFPEDLETNINNPNFYLQLLRFVLLIGFDFFCSS